MELAFLFECKFLIIFLVHLTVSTPHVAITRNMLRDVQNFE